MTSSFESKIVHRDAAVDMKRYRKFISDRVYCVIFLLNHFFSYARTKRKT